MGSTATGFILMFLAQVFQLSGHSPSAPLHKRRLSQLQRHPPPRGFEDFFAKLARDPLVQAVPSGSEDDVLGQNPEGQNIEN